MTKEKNEEQMARVGTMGTGSDSPTAGQHEVIPAGFVEGDTLDRLLMRLRSQLVELPNRYPSTEFECLAMLQTLDLIESLLP